MRTAHIISAFTLATTILSANAENMVTDQVRNQANQDPLAAAGSRNFISLRTTMHTKITAPPPNDLVLQHYDTRKEGKYSITKFTTTDKTNSFTAQGQILHMYGGRIQAVSNTRIDKIAYKSSPESPAKEIRYIYYQTSGIGTEYQSTFKAATLCKLTASRKAEYLIEKLPGEIHKYTCNVKHTLDSTLINQSIQYYSDYVDLLLGYYLASGQDTPVNSSEIEFITPNGQKQKSTYGDLRQAF